MPPKKATKDEKRAKAKPQLAVALFCERAIQDGEGVFTIIRMVDSLTLSATALPPNGTVVPLPVTGLFGFRAHGFKGKLPFLLTQVSPAGAKHDIANGVADLKGGMTGAFITAPALPLLYETNGTYRYEVRLDRRLLATIPLKVVFELAADAPEGTSQKGQKK